MSKNKFPKSVSFNKNNADDKSILNHVKRRNFSGYVKKLILADMAQNGAEKLLDDEISLEKETATAKIERLRAELSGRSDHVKDNADSSADS